MYHPAACAESGWCCARIATAGARRAYDARTAPRVRRGRRGGEEADDEDEPPSRSGRAEAVATPRRGRRRRDARAGRRRAQGTTRANETIANGQARGASASWGRDRPREGERPATTKVPAGDDDDRGAPAAALRFGAASTRILTCFTHSPFRVRDDGPNETACRPPLPASTAPLHALIPSTPCARPDRVRASLGS